MSNARENVNLLTSTDWGIATLRLANWGSGAVPAQVILKTNWVAGDGGGIFRYDASDTTTADNGGTIIVDAAGNRWKRQFNGGAIRSSWFGSTETALKSCIATAEASTRHVLVDRDYTITTEITCSTSNVLIEGEGPDRTALSVISTTNNINLLTITGSGVTVRNISFEHNGASGRIVNFASGEFQEISECKITSTNTTNSNSMVYFRGSFFQCYDNSFVGFGNASRYMLECDRRTDSINIESKIYENDFGGTSSGLLIYSSDNSSRPEGLEISHNTFINTGTWQLKIQRCLLAKINNNVFDQGGDRCVELLSDAQGIDTVLFTGNWFSATQADLLLTVGSTVGFSNGMAVTTSGSPVYSGTVTSIVSATQIQVKFNTYANLAGVNLLGPSGSPSQAISACISQGIGVFVPSGSITAPAGIGFVNNFFGFCGYGFADQKGCSNVSIVANTFRNLNGIGLILTETKKAVLSANTFSEINSSASCFNISDGAAGGPFSIVDNQFQAGTVVLYTPTNKTKFHFDGNTGINLSSLRSATVNANVTGAANVNIPHGLAVVPALEKILATWTQEPVGEHSDVFLRIVSVDATNVVSELVWTTVVAGNLRVNVRAEA